MLRKGVLFHDNNVSVHKFLVAVFAIVIAGLNWLTIPPILLIWLPRTIIFLTRKKI